ncbi:uncharacterized protein LOC122091129 [Macadamia integrifolia]|uniref:uncharacterized protein LOC122091129 n=1 Tax=Macadamia integrifolia TaxID=60698 RepID=UPI001C4E727D|nr:uncharacterized protein LOC122091129 [Macadamia integrifolia]
MSPTAMQTRSMLLVGIVKAQNCGKMTWIFTDYSMTSGKFMYEAGNLEESNQKSSRFWTDWSILSCFPASQGSQPKKWNLKEHIEKYKNLRKYLWEVNYSISLATCPGIVEAFIDKNIQLIGAGEN